MSERARTARGSADPHGPGHASATLEKDGDTCGNESPTEFSIGGQELVKIVK